MAICNRAIHGEDIRQEDAASVVGTGGELLEVLEQLARESAVRQPERQEVIRPTEVDGYTQSRYRLTTVVPLVENPERRTYELTHEELEEFFDGYSEFAEFVVGIERLAH